MRKIAVCVPYVPGRSDARISAAAAELGFSVDYYDTPESLSQISTNMKYSTEMLARI